MNGVIYGNITNMTPLYNFIDDSYFAKMPVLRHLSQRLILSGLIDQHFDSFAAAHHVTA